MAYQRIRQPKLSDVIEQELERLIVEGTLSPGQQLPPERELAKQFEVSRPSIREAIQRLEAKRLLTRRQGGGTFVSDRIWQSFSDPLLNLLSSHSETQLDLLEARLRWKAFAPILRRCVVPKKILLVFNTVSRVSRKLRH
ncbi:pyruvate dehydrogenase complex repressor [Vibrio cholerae]|nr:pyruvate dehydrogenase complex repressor [Vibrio cholerae]